VTIEVVPVDLGPGVRAGFSTRSGGFSDEPWNAANLGLGVDDDPDRVHANRGLLADWIGAPVHFAHQIHGTDVLIVDADHLDKQRRAPFAGLREEAGTADALVTDVPGVALGVLVADCVPVLLADPVSGAAGAAHAGRRGLAGGVVQRTVEALLALGARVEDLWAVVGPAAGGCCYEVPERLRAEVAAVVEGSSSITTWGTASLDLPAGAAAILGDLGVGHVHRVTSCTITDRRFYSYRRDGVTGRFAGVVRTRPPSAHRHY
jgi:YfiH family protein